MDGDLKTFGWVPVLGSQENANPRVKVVKFGDGYEQRGPDGINVDLRTFSLTFRYSLDEINLIEMFLRDHRGYKAFIYRPTMRPVPIRVVCEKWHSKRVSVRKSELTAEFREVVA